MRVYGDSAVRAGQVTQHARTQDGGQLRPHPIQHGPDQHGPEVERKHADVPQHGQLALLPGAAAAQRCLARLCRRPGKCGDTQHQC